MTARGTADKVRIVRWLKRQGLAQYARTFKEHNIGLDVLPELGDDDLKELAIPLGDRKRLLKAIADLRMSLESADDPMTSAAARGPPTRRVDPERRQLTLLFCDLVAWTELSNRLDPEDLREVVCAYQACVAAVVERFEGHVAKYLGDGVLVYFGYPRAHEDDAERAVRSGLAIAEAVAALVPLTDVQLQARVGIATGTAVVGDLIGEGASREAAVVGEVPNLAARMQVLAAPNTVVISDSTRRLVGGLFEVDDVGPQRLKGFAEPLRCWRVVAESAAEGRFEALHGARLTPLVGREEEIALLLRCWRETRDGEGQVVLLAGEPGIGKSRLVRELRARLSEQPHIRLLCQCSPHHTASPLHPLIEQLERAAGFARTDPPAMRLDKLEALLARGTQRLDEVVPLIAALLGVPTVERYPALTLTPDVQKRRTLQALVDQVAGLAAEQPVLALFKDVHWIDPSTLELLGMVVKRIRQLPVLVLITFRPEFQPSFTGQAHVTALTVSRLDRGQEADLIARVTGKKPLPAEIVEQILARTDGVPLFIEELTKTVLESGLLADAGDHYELSGPLPPLAIPATLHDSLMARLDRLAPVKEVAQIGAALGREFSYVLLAAVAGRPEPELQGVLDQLVASELVFRRGKLREAIYAFKHALVQEAAYQSLLKSRRQQLHARIAEVLEQQFPEIGQTQPEVLAQHLTEAGLAAQAIPYWRRAGELAAERSADVEAIAHLSRGLELVATLPDAPERAGEEFALRMAIGGPLIATQGHAAPEVERTYSRAWALCDQLGRSAELFPVLRGLWNHHMVRGELRRAHDLSARLVALAEEQRTLVRRAPALRARGTTLVLLGRFADAEAALREGIAIDDAVADWENPAHLLLYTERAGVVCRLHLAWTSWFLGFPDRALESVEAGLALGRRLGHVHSLAFALIWAALIHNLRREFAEAGEPAEAAIQIACEHRLPQWLALAKICRGYALVGLGQRTEGIGQLQTGLSDWNATGARVLETQWLGFTAEARAQAGRFYDALAALDRAAATAAATGECHYQAELHRLRGAVLAETGEFAEAASWLQRAIDTAHSQQAKSLELRAATSLARLRRNRGKRTQAHDLLAPVYGGFNEGFDTADLKDAKALLDELA
jgi:class 3 adenylate cyclase/predicted ATPase